MTTLFDEHQQWFDDVTGELIVNGFVYIGVVKLDPLVLANQIVIYSDRDLSVPIANPQTTDANGQTGNKVWVPGEYSITVTDSADVSKYVELDNGTTQALNLQEGTPVASAAAIDPWATDGNTIHLTGTTTVSSLGTAPNIGATRTIINDSEITFTHSANLNLPGAADITFPAGSSFDIYADTLTQIDVTNITYSDGRNNGPVSGTPTDISTGEITYNYLNLPSWVTRIDIPIAGLGTSGSSVPIIQIGDSGGIDATGYIGSVTNIAAGSATSLYPGLGFYLKNTWGVTEIAHGTLTLTRENTTAKTWVGHGIIARSDIANISVTAGSKSLTGTLDRIRLATAGGADTFTAGEFNILYS